MVGYKQYPREGRGSPKFMSRHGLVGRRGDWTPEEAARFEIALCSGLARDKKAQRVYLAKLRVVESARAKRTAAVPYSGGITPDPSHAGTAAGGRSSRSPGTLDASAAEPSARRQKSEAQRRKSGEKLQHKWLQRRCEAAATKPGGVPPKILGRVLACCGRFLYLLHPDGVEMMTRLRQAEAQTAVPMDAVDTGLDAMRWALKATQAASLGAPKVGEGGQSRSSARAAPPRAVPPTRQASRVARHEEAAADRCGPDGALRSGRFEPVDPGTHPTTLRRRKTTASTTHSNPHLTNLTNLTNLTIPILWGPPSILRRLRRS